MLLDEIKENVLNQSPSKVDIEQLQKYHTLVFNEPFKVNCSMCILEAYMRVNRYYKESINTDDYKVKYYLKVALIKLEKEQRFELCDFIKKRLA